MPARLVKIGPHAWKVRWRDGTKSAKGRYIERSTGILDKPAAAAEKRRLDAEQKQRRELKRGRPGRVLSLPTITAAWARWALATDIAGEEHTKEVRHVLDGLFERQGWATTHDVSPGAVATWRTQRDGKGTDKPLSMLKSVLRYARDQLRQPVDPLVIATPGRRGRRRRAQPALLTEHQVAELVARALDRGGASAGAIVEHLATYGCRPIDACRLRVRDFNAVGGLLTLRQTKNGETVTHPLLERHVERYRQLVAERRGDEPLFLNPKGEGWSVAKSAGQLLDWYTANVSEHLLPRPQWGLYLLKDYAISAMDRAGVDDRTKALFTGHQSLAVFERYKATNSERAVAALEALAARPGIAGKPIASAPQVRPETH